MATLAQLLQQYGSYNTQRNVQDVGIRLPGGVQGPDGYLPCYQTSLGCGEITGKTAIPGSVYWMPSGVPSSTPTVYTSPVVDVNAERDKVAAALRAEEQRQLSILLGALDSSSAAYRQAYAAIDQAVTPVIQRALDGLQYIGDVSRYPQLQQIGVQQIDDAAAAAYAAWLASTKSGAVATANEQVTAAAGQVQAAGAMLADLSPAGGGAVQTAVQASNTAVSQVPGIDSALSWYQSVKDRFLRAPAELRADLARLDALRALAPANAPDLQGLPAIEQALRNLLMDWPSLAVTGQQIDAEISSSGGSPGLATLTRIVGLAGMVLNFFARKATAEASLDVLARNVLAPSVYDEWHRSAPPEEDTGGGVPWALLAGVGLAVVGVRAVLKSSGGRRRR